MSAGAFEINAFLQQQLRRRDVDEVNAVEAAGWLDAAGLLKDSSSRPGLPLRNMLRRGEIYAAAQIPPAPHGRWFIRRADQPIGDRAPPERREVRRRPGEISPNAEDDEARTKARRRRERAATKYRPGSVKLLLLAEAPPSSLDRYFYFDAVAAHDSLFRYVARAILKAEPTRVNKKELLGRLRDRGVFLIDLWPDPIGARPDRPDVTELIRRIRRLSPEKIIVIKTSVFDLVRGPLLDAGLPLVDERVPFPGSGQQRKFERAFARALARRRATT